MIIGLACIGSRSFLLLQLSVSRIWHNSSSFFRYDRVLKRSSKASRQQADANYFSNGYGLYLCYSLQVPKTFNDLSNKDNYIHKGVALKRHNMHLNLQNVRTKKYECINLNQIVSRLLQNCLNTLNIVL